MSGKWRCQINQRRFQSRCLSDQQKAIDTAEKTIDYLNINGSIVETGFEHKCRPFQRTAYGGINECSFNGSYLDITHKYRLVKEPKNWFAAKIYCSEIGARLFGDLNGSIAQLQFFEKLLNTNQFWIGISDLEWTGVWTSTSNVDVHDVIQSLWIPNRHVDQNHKKVVKFTNDTAINRNLSAWRIHKIPIH